MLRIGMVCGVDSGQTATRHKKEQTHRMDLMQDVIKRIIPSWKVCDRPPDDKRSRNISFIHGCAILRGTITVPFETNG
jgi:hypothetical protein